MLDELRVANFGVIAAAGLEPGPGLVVVTGETGAGKTLLFGALRALTGGPARRDQVGPAGEEAVISGRFMLDGETELVVSRRIVESGRSRAYLDGEIAPLKELQRRTSGLVEIVGQHDHLTLQQPAGIRRLIDGALDSAGLGALDAYRTAWEHHRALVELRATLGGDRRALERELETARHQVAEITAAAFTPGEDVALQERAERLRNAGAIVAELQAAAGAVGDSDGAADLLGNAVAALRRASRLGPGLDGLAAQATEAAALLADLAAEIARAGEDLEQHPDELESVEQRLSLLCDLRRKY